MKITRYIFITLLSICLALIVYNHTNPSIVATSSGEAVELDLVNTALTQAATEQYRNTLLPWISFLILSILAWFLVKSKVVAFVLCLLGIGSLAWSYVSIFQTTPGYRFDQKWSSFLSSQDTWSIAMHSLYILSAIVLIAFLVMAKKRTMVERIT